MSVPAPTPEAKVAEFIVDRVNDGDTIQLGIGGIINAIAAGLESKQHLGCFTEMFSDAFVELQQRRHRQLAKELHAGRFSCRVFDWHTAPVRFHS